MRAVLIITNEQNETVCKGSGASGENSRKVSVGYFNSSGFALYTGSLFDSVLTESAASAETFDLMAGVVAGDDSKAVEL